MLIPYSSLQPATLDNLIEAFIDREGTDYGEYEYSRDSKIAQVRQQIEAGIVIILFDESTESCNLVLAEHYTEV